MYFVTLFGPWVSELLMSSTATFSDVFSRLWAVAKPQIQYVEWSRKFDGCSEAVLKDDARLKFSGAFVVASISLLCLTSTFSKLVEPMSFGPMGFNRFGVWASERVKPFCGGNFQPKYVFLYSCNNAGRLQR